MNTEYARLVFDHILALNNTPDESVDWQPLLELLPLGASS